LKPEKDFQIQDYIPYAAWSPNDGIRMRSASGGAFAECALAVLKNGGVVVGAAINGKNVNHIAITEVDDLHKLQNSKYIQSNTAGIYKTTKAFLKEGKTVLFSGTPCQVAGLISFVGKTCYLGQLFTAQVVCHGVPSGYILDLFERIRKEKIAKIHSFRSKENGWRKSHVFTYTEAQGQIKILSGAGNLFSKLYGIDLMLRSSCYDCKFCSLKGSADISLADYWGGRDHVDEHFKGVSLVIVHSKAGEKLLRDSSLVLHQTTWEKALPLNPRIMSGKNWLYYHPARFFLRAHLRYLPEQLLEKIYANTIGKFDFIFYLYKCINQSLYLLNKFLQKKVLKSILTNDKFQ
jgi:hypothetical protein